MFCRESRLIWRFVSHDDLFYFKHKFFKFCYSFVPDFEKVQYLVHLNSNMNDTLVGCNSDEEFVLNITGIHDEKVLDKQSLSGCYHSEIYLDEEVNDIFYLNERIKSKFVSKNVVNSSKPNFTKAGI